MTRRQTDAAGNAENAANTPTAPSAANVPADATAGAAAAPDADRRAVAPDPMGSGAAGDGTAGRRARPDATPDITALSAAASTAAGIGPPWLRDLRRQSLQQFTARGLPSPREEEWRHVNVSALGRTAFTLPTADRASDAAQLQPRRLDETWRAACVDGRFAAAASDLRDLPAGVVVQSLTAVLASDAHTPLHALVRRHLGAVADPAVRPFVALNTAGFIDGVVVHVPDGVVLERPLHLLFWTGAGTVPVVTFPRVLVVAGRGAAVSVIETHASHAGTTCFTDAVTEISVGEGARVMHVKLQEESLGAWHLAAVHLRQARNSTFRSLSLALGARLAREEIATLFTGEGGECTLDGLYAGSDQQLLATHSTVDHAVPHCTSSETYRGILAGRARGMFRGRVVVRPGADKTDARQSNKNLLLSQHASVDTKPQLEIHADDVKCAHGAAIGQLDPAQLFYLRARGIAAEEARRLLVHAFACEITAAVPLPQLRARVDSLLHERLDDVAEAAGATTQRGATSRSSGATEVA